MSASASFDAVPQGANRAMALLDADELAARWKVSKAQIYRLSRERRIPCVAIGRYYRFRLAAIEAWEQAQERSSNA